MVAVMGLSSTLAGTISINSGQTVEFGQGIVSTAACDASISIAPVSTYTYAADTAGAFDITAIVIDKVGWDSPSSGIDSAGRGCRGQVLELRAFNATQPDPLPFYNSSDSASVGEVLTIYIPETSSTTGGTPDLSNAPFFVKRAYDWTTSVGTVPSWSPTLTVSGVMASGTATGDGMKLTIGGLLLSSSVTKFTLESRSPRTGASEATS